MMNNRPFIQLRVAGLNQVDKMRMFKDACTVTLLGLLTSPLMLSADIALHPRVISQQELASDIKTHPRVTHETHEDGSKALDVFSMLSSDKKFIVGTYQSKATREVIDKPYGVDEYMHFLVGGVTLTSSDGRVTQIKAGDSVTIPKEWTGIWDTLGYTKIYVIYSADEELE
ncbi:MAG: putative cupin superfamily protein [Oceanicoccus sp.]|jgi:uncharacterized cupin superfamily protein